LDLNDGVTGVSGWWSGANVLNVRDSCHISLGSDNLSVRVLESALEVQFFGSSIVVLELIVKHTSQMDVGVASSRGEVGQDVFNQEWLEELVGV
jgi:hypothetical protein